MRRGYTYLTSLLLATALGLPLLSAGGAEHRYTRVHDPYYNDYHRWSPDEDAYYRRSEAEGHREHREFGQRRPEEQQEYWAGGMARVVTITTTTSTESPTGLSRARSKTPRAPRPLWLRDSDPWVEVRGQRGRSGKPSGERSNTRPPDRYGFACRLWRLVPGGEV
jgi:hypothetical protein